MTKQSILTALAASVLTGVIFYFILGSGNTRIAYFDFQKVYNESSMKKNLEKDLEKVVNTRKNQLDSLRLELSLMSNKIDANKASALEISNFEVLKEQFMSRQNMYEEENIRLKETYFNQITKEISDKARLFCEKEGYDFLLTNREGILVYGAESKNVSREFQQFINR